jgi:arginyl-tRNA--protein-N-Asp/Glu arginylyltransferase
MTYLNWKTEIITDFSDKKIESMYDRGYVFTRLDKGVMNQTRSFRVDMSKFELSSENRRILKKNADIEVVSESIPYAGYTWQIGKLAKDFYEKFGDNVFTANKIKEVMTDAKKSNFNELLVFSREKEPVGYAICYENDSIIHYSYPFYDLAASKDIGLGMMLKLLEWAKNNAVKYVYLGSLQRPTDTYKLQFKGGEWFDGERWQSDYTELKEILK